MNTGVVHISPFTTGHYVLNLFIPCTTVSQTSWPLPSGVPLIRIFLPIYMAQSSFILTMAKASISWRYAKIIESNLVAYLFHSLNLKIWDGDPLGVFTQASSLGDLIHFYWFRFFPLREAPHFLTMVCSLLGGSFSLREVISFQLSSQDLLSESSPLSQNQSLWKNKIKNNTNNQN